MPWLTQGAFQNLNYSLPNCTAVGKKIRKNRKEAVGAGRPFGLHLYQVKTALGQKKPTDPLGTVREERPGWEAHGGLRTARNLCPRGQQAQGRPI